MSYILSTIKFNDEVINKYIGSKGTVSQEEDFNIFDFSRLHSMAQRTHAGAMFKELLIANYDFYERIRSRPLQLNLFEKFDETDENKLKECILTCKAAQW